MQPELPPDMVARATEEIEESMARFRDRPIVAPWWESWKVNVPEYDADGVVIKRFEVSEQEAFLEELRAAFNPQRPNRAVQPGTYTSLTVDGTLWMTDTPAEISDLLDVDERMHEYGENGTMLIVGLGLGLVLQRAIVHRRLMAIDVVERDKRVIAAVEDYYLDLAEEHGSLLAFHHDDIHTWKRPRNAWWDIGWFDIWADIAMDDRAEVKLLRDRFRRHLGWFGAWAQAGRNAQARRIRNKTGLY